MLVLLTIFKVFIMLMKVFVFVSFLVSEIIIIIFIIDIILFNEIMIYDDNSLIKNLINEFFIL